jgi:predicted nucleic acid-binding protein
VTVSPYHQGFVLDASVAAKWFVRQGEADRELALSIRDRHTSGLCRLIVPEFALLEVGNAIRYSARAGESDGAAALDLLRDLSIEIHALSWDLLRKANAISWAYKIAMYDAAYVALAEGVGFPLLTADEGLLKKLKGHSIVLRLRDLAIAEPS